MNHSEIPLTFIRSQIQFRECVSIDLDSIVVLESTDCDCDSYIWWSISYESSGNTIASIRNVQY